VKLDPELEAALRDLPRQDFADIDACRARSQGIAGRHDRSTTPSVSFVDARVPREDGSTLRVRVVHDESPAEDAPVLLHLHGGGFCLGDPDYDEPIHAELVRRTGVVIVSPEYRRAPEHAYPAALDDCTLALRWLASADFPFVPRPRSFGVAGDSAGGGLAAATALWARDFSPIALAAQFLLEPELDARLQTRSMVEGTDTPVWWRSNAELSWKHYLAGRKPDQYASPALAATVAGLPRTYLTVNQADPLRDEGLDYALRLMDADVLTEVHCWPGACHGFLGFPARVARDALDDLVRVIAAYLG